MSATGARPAFGLTIRRPDLDRLAPIGRWLAHLAEMVLAMLIGMEVLFGEFAAVANALGYPNAMVRLPELSTIVMAATMTVPMALWMDYRGHPRRGIAEMSATMVLPAVVILAAGTVGLVGRTDLTATYHLSMYIAMVGLMAYRWSEYSGGISHESPVDAPLRLALETVKHASLCALAAP